MPFSQSLAMVPQEAVACGRLYFIGLPHSLCMAADRRNFTAGSCIRQLAQGESRANGDSRPTRASSARALPETRWAGTGCVMHVGFIGLGIMGAPMALNIRKRGHRLTVYNRTPDKARALVEAGATLAPSPQEIGDVEVLITCVADGAAEDAMLLDSGLIDRLPKSAVHASCTTMGID